jgi:aarF domain-containing kinase
LIDYGQVKRVDASVRRNYAKLTLAILAEDKKEIARLCQSPSPFGFGGDSRNRDEDVAYRLAMFWNDRDTPDVTLGLNLQEFLDEMEARDPVIKAPKDMVMIARVSMLLRGVANAFNVRLRVAEAWRTHAAALLAETDPDYYLLSRDTKQ